MASATIQLCICSTPCALEALMFFNQNCSLQYDVSYYNMYKPILCNTVCIVLFDVFIIQIALTQSTFCTPFGRCRIVRIRKPRQRFCTQFLYCTLYFAYYNTFAHYLFWHIEDVWPPVRASYDILALFHVLINSFKYRRTYSKL